MRMRRIERRNTRVLRVSITRWPRKNYLSWKIHILIKLSFCSKKLHNKEQLLRLTTRKLTWKITKLLPLKIAMKDNWPQIWVKSTPSTKRSSKLKNKSLNKWRISTKRETSKDQELQVLSVLVKKAINTLKNNWESSMRIFLRRLSVSKIFLESSINKKENMRKQQRLWIKRFNL